MGYSVILNCGEGFFRWSEYYLIPMMEVKARKKRELSAEPVGKTHRCISRYIRALGEKHEPSAAFNSIHTSLAPFSLPVFLPSPLSLLSKTNEKKGEKCYRAQALSVAVAMEVRKRRIRAHLQQRVKTCADEAEEVEVEVVVVVQEEERIDSGEWEECEYSIPGNTGLNLPMGCRLFHVSTAESPQITGARPSCLIRRRVALSRSSPCWSSGVSVSLSACVSRIGSWSSLFSLPLLPLQLSSAVIPRERGVGGWGGACRRFDCFQMCVFLCMCVCACAHRCQRERGRENVQATKENQQLVTI